MSSTAPMPQSSTGGFLGSLGRVPRITPETVVTTFTGGREDLDVAFWNIEWFNRHVDEKLQPVARFIADMNCDVWSIEETSPQATALLVAQLRDRHGLDFAFAASEPNAPSSKQTTTVMWNRNTVSGKRDVWPDAIEPFLRWTSHEDLSDLPDPQIVNEAVQGKIFDRYPALFHLEVLGRPADSPFDFYLVPLHLKAMDEGSLRRRLACQILASAVAYMINQGSDKDFILGGDMNAPLQSGDFDNLKAAGLTPISAKDAEAGAFSYVKGPQSLIDHVYLSANLSREFGPEDFFIVAADRVIPDYTTEMSDHRPVLTRLSLKSVAGGPAPAPESGVVPIPDWARGAFGL
jgi:endonuclease/exonuclease/phosphatase family metal-dependent hydrolase